jgi:hypothetical protein
MNILDVKESFNCRWKHIWKLCALFGESGLHNDSINVLQIGDLLQSVIFGIIFQEFIEWIGYQEGILKLWQFSQLIELIPTFYPVI